MARRKTNAQVVKQMMEFSPHGAMAQLVIIEAIRWYVDRVAVADPAKFDNPMINGVAWVETAKDIQRQMIEFYDN
jgi:hypothetical protein